MGQTSGLHNARYVFDRSGGRELPSLTQESAERVTERSADTGHLKSVSEAVMNVIHFSERMDLSLAREPAEWGRENDAIIIALEGGTGVLGLGRWVISRTRRERCRGVAFVAEEVLPIESKSHERIEFEPGQAQ